MVILIIVSKNFKGTLIRKYMDIQLFFPFQEQSTVRYAFTPSVRMVSVYLHNSMLKIKYACCFLFAAASQVDFQPVRICLFQICFHFHLKRNPVSGFQLNILISDRKFPYTLFIFSQNFQFFNREELKGMIAADEKIRMELPELPEARFVRFRLQFGAPEATFGEIRIRGRALDNGEEK